MRQEGAIATWMGMTGHIDTPITSVCWASQQARHRQPMRFDAKSLSDFGSNGTTASGKHQPARFDRPALHWSHWRAKIEACSLSRSWQLSSHFSTYSIRNKRFFSRNTLASMATHF